MSRQRKKHTQKILSWRKNDVSSTEQGVMSRKMTLENNWGQIMQGLVIHLRDFHLYSKNTGNPGKDVCVCVWLQGVGELNICNSKTSCRLLLVG